MEKDETEVKAIKVKRSSGEREEMVSKTAYDDVKGDLVKEKEKDKNFKKLRNGTKKEKEDIKKSQEELNAEQQEFRVNMIKERQTDALSAHNVTEEEDIKKVMYNYDRIDPDKPAVTKDEINTRMREAVNMRGIAQGVNPLHQDTAPSGYRGFVNKSKESDESKEMRKDMRISDEDKKKYGDDNWQPKFN